MYAQEEDFYYNSYNYSILICFSECLDVSSGENFNTSVVIHNDADGKVEDD